MNWDDVDDVPSAVLNRILWWDAKGWDKAKEQYDAIVKTFKLLDASGRLNRRASSFWPSQSLMADSNCAVPAITSQIAPARSSPPDFTLNEPS